MAMRNIVGKKLHILMVRAIKIDEFFSSLNEFGAKYAVSLKSAFSKIRIMMG
jgi:hypothetical protein